jgi:hypothetical protein
LGGITDFRDTIQVIRDITVKMGFLDISGRPLNDFYAILLNIPVLTTTVFERRLDFCKNAILKMRIQFIRCQDNGCIKLDRHKQF